MIWTVAGETQAYPYKRGRIGPDRVGSGRVGSGDAPSITAWVGSGPVTTFQNNRGSCYTPTKPETFDLTCKQPRKYAINRVRPRNTSYR